MNQLIFLIPGRPKPQKQTVHGKGFHWDPSKKDSDWMRWSIQEQCKEVPNLPSDLPVLIKCVFTFLPPKTSLKRKRMMLSNEIKHTKRPDGSNLYYLVENAMKGVVYRDDSQVYYFEVLKQYGEKEVTQLEVTLVGETL